MHPIAIGTMVKDHILSYLGQSKKARILIVTCAMHCLAKYILSIFLWSTELFYFLDNELFPSLFADSLISGIYGVVVTLQNGGDRAECIATKENGCSQKR